jgi:hypothetical protein
MAVIKAGQEKTEAMMEACLEKTETTDLEANPEKNRVPVGASGSP